MHNMYEAVEAPHACSALRGSGVSRRASMLGAEWPVPHGDWVNKNLHMSTYLAPTVYGEGCDNSIFHRPVQEKKILPLYPKG